MSPWCRLPFLLWLFVIRYEKLKFFMLFMPFQGFFFLTFMLFSCLFAQYFNAFYRLLLFFIQSLIITKYLILTFSSENPILSQTNNLNLFYSRKKNTGMKNETSISYQNKNRSLCHKISNLDF